MSASYYTECPRCKKRGEKELEAAYGNVPEEEYMEMKERHEDYEFYETVRVDRETHGKLDEDGNLVLTVYMFYECGRCLLTGELKDEKVIEQDQPKWEKKDWEPSNFHQLDLEKTFHP